MSDVLTPSQRRTLPARIALAAKFSDSEAKREFYREIGERGNAGRVTLSAADAEALATAFKLLSTIADKLPAPASPESS